MATKTEATKTEAKTEAKPRTTRIAAAHLESISPYGQSKHYSKEAVPKLGNETDGDYEARTWINRGHFTDDGNVFIPPIAFKKAMESVAKYLGTKIKGQRNKTYTAKYMSALLVPEPVVLDVTRDQIGQEWLFVPSDGKRGGATRVNKCFPRIDDWKAVVKFYIFDEVIEKTVFEDHLSEAGRYIGIGMFRPERGGHWGRFRVTGVDWTEV